MDEWVRVKDRLPECTKDLAGNKASDDVLIIVNGEIYSAYLEAVRPDFKKLIWSPNIGDDCFDIEEYHGDAVTHWMPLPEPPRD